MVLLSKPSRLSVISDFKESTAAKTAMIEKIPIVTPSKDKNVRNLLFTNALMAKIMLSLRTRK